MQKYITKDDLKNISLKPNRVINQQPKSTNFCEGCFYPQYKIQHICKNNKWRQKK